MNNDKTSVRSVRTTYHQLVAAHPDAHCELEHANAFQLIVATALSAQSTDVQVNRVTPGLFAAYPTPHELARANQEEVEALINRLGMFRQKAKNLIGMAQALVRDHGGEVPRDLPDLVKLPGVGRKTANVVLGVAFQTPVGVVVDTHVGRITQRLGWTQETTPEKIEQDLMRLLPRSEWDRVSHTLIFHGRRICDARKPACSTCPVQKRCPSAFAAEEVGRKPKKDRATSSTAKARPLVTPLTKKKTSPKTTSSKTTSSKLASSKLASSKTTTSKATSKERTSKERTSKERTSKERTSKERTSKEQTSKEQTSKERTSKKRPRSEANAKGAPTR